MNSKTIDGVPRELRPLLAMILNALDRDAADGKAARGEMASELRALLDAPVCKECEGVGYHVTMGVQRSCWACKPAAQPQGEPVAWIKPDVAKTLRKDECCYAFGSQNPKGTLIPLYAEQPAPVACPGDGLGPCKKCRCERNKP